MNQPPLIPPMGAICPGCGKTIITERRKDSIYSEYSDAQGLCWQCSLKQQIKESRRKV